MISDPYSFDPANIKEQPMYVKGLIGLPSETYQLLLGIHLSEAFDCRI
jgi:hypothetical protein